MPPYPFAPSIKASDFLKRIQEEDDCTFKCDDLFSYIEREIDAEKIQVAVELDLNEYMQWSVVRSLCNVLRIDSAKFGLTIG